MWTVDRDFLDGLRTDGGPHVIQVRVTADKPYFDIEVISDVRLDMPIERLPDDKAELEFRRVRTDILDRFKRLRQSFEEGGSPHLLINCGDLGAGHSMDNCSPARHSPEMHRVMYEKVWIPVFEEIGGNLAETFLSVPGNHDLLHGECLGGSAASAPPEEMGSNIYYQTFLRHFLSGPGRSDRVSNELPVALVYRICADDDTASPIAYVVVIGFDSNDVAYRHEELRDYGQISETQIAASRRLIRTLLQTDAASVPVYVLAVTHHNLLPVEDKLFTGSLTAGVQTLEQLRQRLECQSHECSCDLAASRICAANVIAAGNVSNTMANASGFLAHSRQVRVSLALHGHMHGRDVLTVINNPLQPGQGPAEISVVACPSFEQGKSFSGMTRVRLNLWKGEAEIAFNFDLGPRNRPGDPVQIVRPLISASRVGSSEQRLHTVVHRLLGNSVDIAGVARYRDYVNRVLSRDGYVPLCDAEGKIPELPVTRRTRYFLLLLLRERKGAPGSYEMLLSHHTPIRRTRVADWGTLLLPAFKSVRDLLEHLRDDVLRQVVEQAEDLGKADQVRKFETAIETILQNKERPEEDVWSNELREIGTLLTRKVSPTNGCVTEYEYKLVTLLPLVQRPASSDQGQADQRQLVEWLNELPSLHRDGVGQVQLGSITLEVVGPDGGGVRWDPNAEPDLGTSSPEGRRGTRLPPGAVWFPVADADEYISPWRHCPSIVARNADVMSWVDAQLAGKRQKDGRFPPELVIGSLEAGSPEIEIVDEYPFQTDDGGPQVVDDKARSTVGALSRVKFLKGFDLEDTLAYEHCVPKGALLMKSSIVLGRAEQTTILVFDADIFEAGQLRALSPTNRARMAMGVLRPVQRYVLKAGLERAEQIYESVLSRLNDPWGFAKVKKGNAPSEVSVTPPIVEQLPEEEAYDPQFPEQFILCDGNHRVVQLVWIDEKILPAVVLMGRPNAPYYAHPYSQYEWHATADNVLAYAPDSNSKYLPRKVDLNALNPAAQKVLARRATRDHFRRYFRDLSTGFGSLGGQGGRYV
jgi:hypothetical protein